jgi:hypothetical protein
VGFHDRTFSREVGARARGRIRLPFEPTGSGFYLILLRDETGAVFGASGTLIFPGIAAG